MSTNSFVQSFQKFFKSNDKPAGNTEVREASTNQTTSELLLLIKVVKIELQKHESGEKSFIADLKALKGDVLPAALNLCEFVANVLLGIPIDDRDAEVEKVIVMFSTLPSDSRLGALISKIFIGLLWNQLPHPPDNFQNQAGYQWRSADASNNNLALPTIGKAGQKYIQDCLSKRPRSDHLPDPGLIFDELLKRCPGKDGRFKASESRVSSNLFYLATLITHDLFDTDEMNRNVNRPTSYLDLSPLYGTTKALQDYVRTGKNGLLKVDRFADTRFRIQPAAVTALVVLFNRNHNYIASNLLNFDENARFSSLDEKQRDEALFQTARLINERTYVNIVLHDYLRVILGVNRVESS